MIAADGEQGEFWLNRYDEDPDLAHLGRAIDHFRAALDTAPGHADSLWWLRCLALAYQERARRGGDPDDWTGAIVHARWAAGELAPGEARDEILLILAEAYRDQAIVATATEEDARAAAAEIDRIAAEITGREASGIVRLLHGLALTWVFAVNADDDCLRAAIGVLEPALDSLGPESPYHDEACVDLCRAHVELAEGDDDLDRAIRAGLRATDQQHPEVRSALACAYQERWDSRDEPDDLDAAIGHWQAALAAVTDPAGQAACGRLLAERAELQQDRDGAGAAIELLEQAVAGGEPVWWELGLAYQLRRELGGDEDDLRRAGKWMDRAIAETASPEWLIYAYAQRLGVTRELIEIEAERDQQNAPPSASDMVDQVAAARAVWESGVGAEEARVRLAVIMGLSATFGWWSHPETIDTGWLVRMVAVGRSMPNKPPGWDEHLDGLDAVAQHADATQRGVAVPEESMTKLLRGLQLYEPKSEAHQSVRNVAPMFLLSTAVRSGDRRMLRAAVDQLRARDDPDGREIGDTMELIDRARHGDLSAVEQLRPRLQRLRDTNPSYLTRHTVMPLLAALESVIDGRDGAYRPVDHSPVAEGGRAVLDRAFLALFGPVHAAVVRHDVDTMRECIGRINELLDVLPAEHAIRPVLLELGGLTGAALLRDEPGDQHAADQLLAWADAGLALVGGPQHPQWASFALNRAEALRQLAGGDRADSRRWGLSALQSFAWQVLLQSGTDDAVLAAADAGDKARRVAGWCLQDAATEDLVAALDAGRALVLQAATASRTIADQLTAAGHPELAEQWRESAGYGRDLVTGNPLRSAGTAFEVPDHLRTRVLRALDLHAPQPASTADIRAALATTGHDALVYLMPATAESPGAVVIVPADGEAATLILPGLIVGPRSMLARHTAVRAARDAGEVTGEQPPAAEDPDGLFSWAWSAAMAALLRHTGTGTPERPIRLVLVPTGALSAVPWHAAYRQQDGRRRYVVEDAVVSYAISARAFIDSAREPARAVKSVLIVGDPTGDLPYAGVEARAIGRAFYPDGLFLGRSAGSGTPKQVLDWIAEAAPGPSLLHLACHGHADPDHPTAARLRLAGGDLTAQELIEASRTAELEIEQVFLAGCSTGAAGRQHDEAFSLATAFLAAGARTAFGTLWKVPDAETSVLMFLVHHHLNTGGCTPAEALRRAQLWMLDTRREPPGAMPAELRGHVIGPALAAPASWAAFTHQGR
ncbi:CHAT domain-containing protein [Actinoplanes sp. NBC_00393]|uniref:CHAT domain-containing protein n=1 Tax=Actinoplanes sp. NBC_00393 TaxID=2975953 RepID=UPI002E20F94C